MTITLQQVKQDLEKAAFLYTEFKAIEALPFSNENFEAMSAKKEEALKFGAKVFEMVRMFGLHHSDVKKPPNIIAKELGYKMQVLQIAKYVVVRKI